MAVEAAGLSVPLWRRIAIRLQIDMRPGERRLACLLFVCFFLIVCFQYATKSVRQSSFLDDLGAINLPWVYLAVALCSYPLLRLYTRFSESAARHRTISVTCLGVAGSTLFFWWFLAIDSIWPAVAFYVWISITYAVTYSQFWSLAAHVFDARQAKRLFGFVTAGGLLGGIAGGQVARLVTTLADTRATLLVACGLMVLLALAILTVPSMQRRGPVDKTSPDTGTEERVRGGLALIRDNRQLRLISGLMVVTILVAQTIDLQFNWAVESSTGALDQRTAFFGNFYSVMNLAAVVFQLMFTAHIHRVVGVGAALKVLPTTMGLGTLALLFSAPFFPAIAVAAALVLKVGENGLRYSLDQSSRELLYVPLPDSVRAKARAYIDVFFHRGAKGLAALLLLPVTFGVATAVQAGWLTLGLVAVWLILASAATREYIRGFRESLKHRNVDRQSPINIDDAATLEVLIQSMASLDSRQVLHSLQILGDHGRADLASPTLLYHDNAEVRLLTLGLLQQAERKDAVPLIEERLGDENAEVRARAMRVLAELQGKDVCVLMQPRLTEHAPAVRAAAVACLSAHGDERMVREAAVVLDELLQSTNPEARFEGAKAIGAVPDPEYSEHLVKLLYDGDQQVLREAINAVDLRSRRDGHNPIYTPVLISSLRNRRVKHEARSALVAMGAAVIPALGHFLMDPDESLWVRRALPKTIARIGGPAAADALLTALANDVHDGFLRRKLIEALQDLPADLVRSRGAEQIPREIELEARSYSGRLLELCSIMPATRVALSGGSVTWISGDWEPQLLDRLLAERIEDHLRNLFGLLTLLYPARHIKAAFRGLTSGRTALKASALEYLDNTLEPELRRTVLPLIDDMPLGEKLETLRRLLGLRRRTKIDTLKAALARESEYGESDTAIALGSLYKIHVDRLEALYDDVRDLASRARSPQIAETASWVMARL